MTGQVEIVIQAESGVALKTGEWQGLRVRYREDGAPLWGRFLVVGAPEQTLLDLVSAALLVVAHSDGNKLLPAGGLTIDRGEVVDGEQLDLGVSA